MSGSEKQRRTPVRGPRVREVPAVSRAIAILRLLGKRPEPTSLSAISEALAIIPSTALHILRVLVAEGLVKFEPDTKRYALDSGMLVLARSVIERSGFATLAQPVLDRVAQEWGTTLMGVEIQHDEHMVVMAISRSRIPFALHTDVGSRFPVLVSATGRLFAAFGGMPPAQLKKRFAALRWGVPIAFERWKSEVAKASETGFAVDRDCYINGVTIVAVPLFDGAGRITHALAAAGLSEQLDSRKARALAASLQQEARSLEAAILPGR